MKKYMLILENGNGYHCGCCRRTSDSHEIQEFENDDACKDYIKNYNEAYAKDRWDNDSIVTAAHQMFGEGNQIV